MSADTRLAYETNNYTPRLFPFYDPAPRSMPRLAEQLAAAAAAGFGAIVLDGGSLDAYLEIGGSFASLRELLQVHSLRCHAIAELSIGSDPDAVVTAAEPLLRAARELGAGYLQAGVMVPVAKCVESAQSLERCAVAAGVNPAIEFMPFGTVNSLRDTQAFFKRAGLTHTRIVLDTWHFFHDSVDWESLESLDPALIAWVQLSDRGASGLRDLMDDTINRRLMPGEGVLELPRFFRTLRRIGFAGTTSCEVLSSLWRAREPHFYAIAEAAAARPLVQELS